MKKYFTLPVLTVDLAVDAFTQENKNNALQNPSHGAEERVLKVSLYIQPILTR